MSTAPIPHPSAPPTSAPAPIEATPAEVDVSLLVPVRDEEATIQELATRVTAVLDRLSGPLCDAVTERYDSHRVLEELHRANLFLIPLDDTCTWYRYHHLFADVLRARLAEERGGEIRERPDQHGSISCAIRNVTPMCDSSSSLAGPMSRMGFFTPARRSS